MSKDNEKKDIDEIRSISENVKEVKSDLKEIKNDLRKIANGKCKEKKDSDDKKMDKNKIFKIVGIVLGVLIVCGLAFWASGLRKSKASVSYLVDITYDKYLELYKGDTASVVLLARPGCSWCQKFKPIITKAANDKKVYVYYLNTDDLDEETYYDVYESSSSLVAENAGGIPTPTTLLVKGGKEIDNISGYTEYDDVVNFFMENGLINE